MPNQTPETPITVHEAVLRVMHSIGVIGKGRHNRQQDFDFRGIDEMVPVVQKALLEHGVTIIPRVINFGGGEHTAKSGSAMHLATVHMEFIISGPSGDKEVAMMVGEALDSGDKAMSKAISMATKYFLFYTFWIPVKGIDDGDADGYEYGAPQVASHPPRQSSSTGDREPRQQERRPAQPTLDSRVAEATARTTGGSSSSSDAITDKQVAFLKRIANDHDWSTERLIDEIAMETGLNVQNVEDLSKREASGVIDALKGGGGERSAPPRQEHYESTDDQREF